VSYGPDANCTLEVCPITASVYEYRLSLAANAVFIALFSVALILHIVQGVRWRTWFFMGAMICGCLSEIIGYGGRIMLYENPFSFTGFLMQICCITIGPAFFSAAIYFTISKITIYLGVEYSCIAPKWYYWLFIPCDLVSLSLQAAGGATSSSSSGSSQTGVDLAIVGLAFQVFTLCVFIALALDFTIRYYRARKAIVERELLPTKFKIFVAFLSLAILTILIRCVYRIDELSDGYSGSLIHNEGLFIGLEGVMIVVATFALNVAQPGPIFEAPVRKSVSAETSTDKV